MTFVARDPAMGTRQGKFRFGMVETADVDPGFGGMARLATQRCPIGALGCHALLEFALVGVGMAGGARHVFEMERQNLVFSSGKAHFVAIRAADGHMGPG